MFFPRMLSMSLLIAVFLSSTARPAQLEFPQPKGWVNDFANVIDADAKKHLVALCAEVDEKTHAQIAVVTIKDLEGTPIGDYARLLFNDWGIGHKEDKRGMLILLSVTDHMYYISVGTGFEPLFPNDRVAAIGAEMIPDLKQRHYSKAVLHSANKIASIIARERGITLTTLHSRSSIH